MEDGPPGDFRTVAREQLPWLYPLARRLAGDQAEEVVQECLVKAHRAYNTLEDPHAAPAWFRQVLLGCVRDRYRQEAGLPREDPADVDDEEPYSLYQKIAEEDPWPYSDRVHLDFLASFEDTDLWGVLDRIDPQYRAPLVLVHMEAISPRQVARMFGVSQDTVLSWLQRGRKLFEREMWSYAEEAGLVEQPVTAERGAEELS